MFRVFEFVFSSIVGSLPRLAEPSLLLQRGVKLGSLLLGDRDYQQKLYSSSNRKRTKLPVTSRRGGGGGGKNKNKNKKKNNQLPHRNVKGEQKTDKRTVVLGDVHLDQEGEVPDRTDRQIREMENGVPPFLGG